MITLKLTEQEAAVLRSICARIGGHPGYTWRKETDSIASKLVDKGVHLDSPKYLFQGSLLAGVKPAGVI